MSDLHFSFEFFPPKSDKGAERQKIVRRELAAVNPDFFSVTFGAGGTTQEGTYETCVETQEDTGIPVAAHISCIGSTRKSIAGLLERYQEAGIKRLVALRGDLLEGMTDPGEFHYGNELVEFIRETTGDFFHIEVGAYPEYHPEATSPQDDFDNLVRKIEAGADAVMTQYFYNVDAYIDMVERLRARGITQPVVPGIMPITARDQLLRFSDRCGAEIPRWIRHRLEAFGDDEASIKAFGHDVVTRLSAALLEAGAPGLHFYTLNRSEATLALWRDLRLPMPSGDASAAA